MSQQLDIIAASLIQKLCLSSQTVATAESCTGGLIAHCLTNIPGASDVFLEGVICYSNAAKTRLLEIPPELIAEQGAVSAQVAQAMAEGIQQKSGATFGLATTGIAGPWGGSEEKPVGTIFMAIAQKEKLTTVWKAFFPEERFIFKQKATKQMMRQLLKKI